MIVSKALYTLEKEHNDKEIDELSIAWYQVSKRLQRLHTEQGDEIAIRFLGKEQRLRQDDVLYEDENKRIVVNILPCEVIILKSDNVFAMVEAAYEIGNKHLPLYWEDGSLLLPFEKNTFEWLESLGFIPIKGIASLRKSFEANVNPDHHKTTHSKTSKLKLLIK